MLHFISGIVACVIPSEIHEKVHASLSENSGDALEMFKDTFWYRALIILIFLELLTLNSETKFGSFDLIKG